VFDEILGLPAHPLMVHAPIVLIPLAVVTAVVYAFVPPLRARLGWLLVLLAFAGAGTSFAAVESGKRLAAGTPANTQLDAHMELGTNVRNFAILLAVVSIVLVGIDAARRGRGRSSYRPASEADGYTYQRPRSGGVLMGAVSVVLSLGLLGAAGTAAFYVARTGHTGAQMVWGRQLP
jgi:uncharacterized membrane protein